MQRRLKGIARSGDFRCEMLTKTTCAESTELASSSGNVYVDPSAPLPAFAKDYCAASRTSLALPIDLPADVAGKQSLC